MALVQDELLLRVTVLHPPQGVAFAMQIGRSDLLPPSQSRAQKLMFDFKVRVDPRRGSAPRLLGPAVQGPPSARFVYVNSGKRAGEPASCWDRRAKVSLVGITWKLIDSVRRMRSSCLEASIVGTAGDGGPACATVPLLEGGWRVGKQRI